jgi:hypothetical protein
MFGDMRRAQSLAVGIAFALVACRGVRGCFGENTDRTLRGKVKVALVQSTNILSGSLTTSRAIRVHASPPFDVPVQCTDADLAENTAGTLVAWRCKSTRSWSLVRLMPSGRHFVEDGVAELGTGSTPAFASAKPFVDSAAHIAEHVMTSYSLHRVEDLDALVAELRGAAPPAVARLFHDIATVPPTDYTDEWSIEVGKLAGSERAELEKSLCAATLGSDASNRWAYARAASICPYDDAAGDVALKILRRESSSGYVDLDRQPVWAGLVAAATKPKEAGEVGCAGLGGPGKALRKVFGALVGLAKTACPAAKKVSCAELAACEGPCTAADAQAAADAWLGVAKLTAPAVRKVTQPTAGLPLAAYAQGPLDPELRRKHERATYKVIAGSGPGCSDPSLPRGAACSCDLPFSAAAACDTSLADTTIETQGACAFRIDDAAHTIGPPVRACSTTPGARCAANGCCAPLKCVYAAGGSVCK